MKLLGCFLLLLGPALFGQDVEVVYMPAPDWVVSQTSVNHTIAIPENSVTFGGVPVPSGSFIALFYDSAGFENCAGSLEISSENQAITAYGAEQAEDNGYQSGETFVWKLWHSDFQNVYDLIPVYDTSASFPDQGIFADDGISKIVQLNVDNLANIEFETKKTEVYPNPASNQVNVILPTLENNRLRIFDRVGRELAIYPILEHMDSQVMELDIEFLEPGMYIFQIDGYSSYKLYKK